MAHGFFSADNYHLPEQKNSCQNHWVFGLCPSSSNLKTRKQNNSKIGSVLSSSGEGGMETPTLMDPLEIANLNH
jgi:hypothetical protein